MAPLSPVCAHPCARACVRGAMHGGLRECVKQCESPAATERLPSHIGHISSLFPSFVCFFTFRHRTALHLVRLQDRIAEGIFEAYGFIYDAIMDPSNGYADPGYSLKHNPEHLKTVLGIR